MKTKLMYLTSKVMVALVLLVILAAKAFAADDSKLVVAPYAKELAVIAYTKPANSYAELSIEDEDGNMVYYSETSFEKSTFSKVFSLKNLLNGDYKVVLRSDNEEVVRCFEYEDGVVAVLGLDKDAQSSIETTSETDVKVTLLLNDDEDLKILFSDNVMNVEESFTNE